MKLAKWQNFRQNFLQSFWYGLFIAGCLLPARMVSSQSVLAQRANIPFDFKDPKEISAVSLTIDSKLEPIVGYAKGISGIVNYNPSHPEETTGSICVEVASVQFANEGYTATARGFALRGDKYPQIRFNLRKVVGVTRLSSDVIRAMVQADFLCKGVTIPLTIPVTASYYRGMAEERTNGKFKGDVLVVRTQFQVSRKRLGISEGIPDNMVGDSVQINVAITGLHYTQDAQANNGPPRDETVPSKEGPTAKVQPTVSGRSAPSIATSSARIDQRAPLDLSLPLLVSSGPDTTANKENLARLQTGKPLVIFCFNEQCGVTYRYKERIARLQARFEPRGYGFIGIRCGRQQSSANAPSGIEKIGEASYLKMRMLDDESGTFMNRFHIQQSLTFLLVDATGALRYRGGLDDNIEEAKVSHHYLVNALIALDRGKPVPIKEGRTLGCAILPIVAPKQEETDKQ